MLKKIFLNLSLLIILSTMFINISYAANTTTNTTTNDTSNTTSNATGTTDSSDTSIIYKIPSRTEAQERQGESGLDQLVEDSNSMIEGDEVRYDREKIKEFTRTLYNIIFGIGIIASIVMGCILGTKIMLGGLETKVQAKSLLIPYTVGCVVIFGGFGIWKLIIEIFQQM